ncbi:MAG: hypothetical protein AAB561_00580 [Patescibacteria group bacterium]
MKEIWEVAMSNLWATLVMSGLLGMVGIVHSRIFFYQNEGEKSLARFRKLFLKVLCCALGLFVVCVWAGTAAFVSSAMLSAIFMILVFAGCVYGSWYAHAAYYSTRASGHIG